MVFLQVWGLGDLVSKVILTLIGATSIMSIVALFLPLVTKSHAPPSAGVPSTASSGEMRSVEYRGRKNRYSQTP